MTTGRLPSAHGVVANGFYWRQKQQIEMWTAPNDCIERPQIWDLLSHVEGALTSAVWFAMHSVGAEADYLCTPKPIHNPDGSGVAVVLHAADGAVRRVARRTGPFPLAAFLGAAGQHPLDGLDRPIGRGCGAAVEPRFLLDLPAAPGLRGPETRPRQPCRRGRGRRTGRRVGPASRRHAGDLRRRCALARGGRVRHHAGRSRRLSQSRAPRGRAAVRPPAGRRRASRSGRQPRLGPGRSPVLARLCGRRRRADHRTGRRRSFAASRALPRCWWARSAAATGWTMPAAAS